MSSPILRSIGRGISVSKSDWNLVRGGKAQIHSTSRLFEDKRWDDPIRNFKDFKYPNQVSTFEHYRLPKHLLEHEFDYPICRDTMGIRWPGYWFRKKFVYVKEMEPELVVPDLDGFELKPYVSYKADEVDTKPFTAKDLFDSVYAGKIAEDFAERQVETYEVAPEEIDRSRLAALQTGADIFEDFTRDGVRAPIEFSE